jgi:hypothetical protein
MQCHTCNCCKKSCTAHCTALQSQPWAAARAHGQPGVADSQITPPQVTALHCTATSCGIKISMAKLAKHIENVHHSQQMGVQCNKCNKEFNSSAILGNQMTRVHGNVSNPEKCGQWVKSFTGRI